MQLAPANFLVMRIGSQCRRSDRELRRVVPAGTGKYLQRYRTGRGRSTHTHTQEMDTEAGNPLRSHPILMKGINFELIEFQVAPIRRETAHALQAMETLAVGNDISERPKIQIEAK